MGQQRTISQHGLFKHQLIEKWLPIITATKDYLLLISKECSLIVEHIMHQTLSIIIVPIHWKSMLIPNYEIMDCLMISELFTKYRLCKLTDVQSRLAKNKLISTKIFNHCIKSLLDTSAMDTQKQQR